MPTRGRPCKHGKLKKPVKTKNGRKRKCKKKPGKTKGRPNRSKKKRKKKSKCAGRPETECNNDPNCQYKKGSKRQYCSVRRSGYGSYKGPMNRSRQAPPRQASREQRERDAAERNRAQFQAMDDAGLINYIPNDSPMPRIGRRQPEPQQVPPQDPNDIRRVGCKVLQEGERCNDDEDPILFDSIDYTNRQNYYRFPDGTCIGKETWNQMEKLENPMNRQPAVCDPENDLNPLNVAKAAFNEDFETVRMLIGLGSDPNGEYVSNENGLTNVGFTALQQATELQATDLITFLVDHGADVNQCPLNNLPPVFLALKNIDILRYLVDKGANLHVNCTINGNDYTIPKFFVVLCQNHDDINIDVLRFLLDNGIDANFNIGNVIQGYTLLNMFCTSPVYDEIIPAIRLLLDRGADPNIIMGNTGKNIKEITRDRMTRLLNTYSSVEDPDIRNGINSTIRILTEILTVIETHSR